MPATSGITTSKQKTDGQTDRETDREKQATVNDMYYRSEEKEKAKITTEQTNKQANSVI